MQLISNQPFWISTVTCRPPHNLDWKCAACTFASLGLEDEAHHWRQASSAVPFYNFFWHPQSHYWLIDWLVIGEYVSFLVNCWLCIFIIHATEVRAKVSVTKLSPISIQCTILFIDVNVADLPQMQKLRLNGRQQCSSAWSQAVKVIWMSLALPWVKALVYNWQWCIHSKFHPPTKRLGDESSWPRRRLCDTCFNFHQKHAFFCQIHFVLTTVFVVSARYRLFLLFFLFLVQTLPTPAPSTSSCYSSTMSNITAPTAPVPIAPFAPPKAPEVSGTCPSANLPHWIAIYLSLQPATKYALITIFLWFSKIISPN